MFRRDLGDEARDPVGGGPAEEHALMSGAQIEPFLGARDGHVAEPALLLHLLRLADGAGAWEQGLLHADEENDREFQSLGAVDGHQDHGVGVGVIVVQIGIERDVCQIPFERQVAGLLHISEDAGAHLAHVLGAGGILGGVLLLERAHIPGLFKQLVENEFRRMRFAEALQFPDGVGKQPQLDGRTLQLVIAVRVREDVEHRAGLPLRKLGDRLHGL